MAAIAEEYLEVVYRLLEASWDDDAVIQDAENLVHTDPDRVHEIGFEGEYFRVTYTPRETLRERMFGAGSPRALPDHPAAEFATARGGRPVSAGP